MKTRNLIGIICGSLAVAACGGGGGGGIALPVSITVPAWVTTGAPISALSANIGSGTSTSAVTFTFNADGSLTFNLGASGNLTVTDADIAASSSGSDGELFFFAVPNGADTDFVELVVLDDVSQPDIVALARVDRFNTPLGYETAAVIGDLTATANLPTGSGTVTYDGFMIGSLLVAGQLPDFNNDGDLDLQYDFVSAQATVNAVFGTGAVDVAFSDFTIPVAGGGSTALTGSSLTSGAMINTGTSRYSGPITGNINTPGGNFGLAGELIGAFFGPAADATAGVFDTNETSGGTGDAEFVGNFAAN